MASLIQLDPRALAGLARAVGEMAAEWDRASKSGGAFEQANIESMHWIKTQARENLQNSIRGNNRPDFRTRASSAVRLEDAIMQDKYHVVTADEIRMFVDHLIQPDVPYYHSLEVGNNYWPASGRKLPFFFLGARRGLTSPNFRTPDIDPRRIFIHRHQASTVRGRRIQDASRGRGGARVTDRIVGLREYQRREGTSKAFKDGNSRAYVRITRPVPAYRYMTKAGRSFVAEGIYLQKLRTIDSGLLRRLGVELV